jgi:hypothetical protein
MHKVTIESIDSLIPELRADLLVAVGSLSDDPILRNLGNVPYPFDSLEVISTIIREQLSDEINYAFENMSNRFFVDLGGANGDISFLFERAGFSCTYVDVIRSLHSFPPIAFALRQKLNSRMTLVEMDIDTGFSQGRVLGPIRSALGTSAKYGLAFFSGVLYHLESPLSALKNIAQICEYCIFTARTFSYFPDNKTYVGDMPLGYFLNSGELAGDPTNYFIFTREAVRRMALRSGWEILAMRPVFSRPDQLSNPVSNEYFERTFAILKAVR